MDHLISVHGRLISLRTMLICLFLLAALALEVTAIRIPSKQSNSDSQRPVLVSRGEALPFYHNPNEEDSNKLMDGVKALGEWMMMVGLTGEEEKAHSDSPIDSGELIDLHVDALPNLESEFVAIRRDESDTVPPAAPPTPTPSEVYCFRRGVLYKCKGYDCRISSMTCEGVLYEGQDIRTYPGTMDQCVVNSLSCTSKIVRQKVFPRSCKIEKFLCPNNQTKLPHEATGESISGCQVQVVCSSVNDTSFTFYGFEAFDFECTNSKLVCDGKVIESPNGYRTSGNHTCEIRPVPCSAVGDITSSCNSISETCVTDPSDNVCSTLVDHSFSCPASSTSPRPYATIESITCGSQTHHYPTWDGSISACLSIRSIKQNDQIIELPYNPANSSYCVLSELDCGGIRTTWNFTARIPEGCGVSRVICGSPPSLLNPTIPSCQRHDFGCKTSPTVCTFTESITPCSVRCMQPGIVETCDCPVEFKGPRCSTPRDLQCDYNVTRATLKRADSNGAIEEYDWHKDCTKGLDKRSLGDPVCHPINSDDLLTVTGSLLCRFTDGPLESLLANTVSEFNYTLWSKNFRLSNVTLTPKWNLWMKILNYNAFTDLSGSTVAYLSPEQMAGNQSVSFTIQPSRLAPVFVPGGRIRAEWQFAEAAKAPIGMNGKVMHGATIDDMQWQPQYPHAQKAFNTRVLAVVLLSLFGVAVAALFIYRFWKKRRHEAAPGSN